MISFIAWVIGVVSAWFIIQLINRVKSLEKRISFLEDRSPQAKYLRKLEDDEKGWGNEIEDVKAMLRHIMHLNLPKNLVLRSLLIANPDVITNLNTFLGRYDVESEQDKVLIDELSTLLSSIDD